MKIQIMVIVFVFSGYVSSGQVETVEDPDAVATITPEEIIEMGQQSPSSTVIVLSFEGLGNSDGINDFYNGGTSSQGFSGVDYGVQFGVALGLIDADAGGTGNFGNEPSPETVMFFLDEDQAFMNVMAGFTTGFAFYYATLNTSYVEVYDGLDGTGNLLGTASLPSNNDGTNCTGDPTGYYCQWDVVSVPFTGTAKSVVFIGAANYVAFDEVTFGSTTPGEPVPVSNWAIIISVILIGAVVWFRKGIPFA